MNSKSVSSFCLMVGLIFFLQSPSNADWCTPYAADCFSNSTTDTLDTLASGVVKVTTYTQIDRGIGWTTTDTVYETALQDTLLALFRSHEISFIGTLDSSICDSAMNGSISSQWVYFSVNQLLKGHIDSNRTHINIDYFEMEALQNRRFIVFVNTLDSLFAPDSVWGSIGSTFLCLNAPIKTGGFFLTDQNKIIKTGQDRLPGISVALDKFRLLTSSEKPSAIVKNSITLSPNPCNPTTTLSFANPVYKAVISVMDIQGRFIIHSKISQGQSFPLNFQGMPSGAYLLTARTGTLNLHKAFILRK